MVHEVCFPSGEAASDAINNRLELRGRGSSNRERDAKVRAGQLDDGASKVLDNRLGFLWVAVQQGRRALGEVDL
jgi:hypothetical protein